MAFNLNKSQKDGVLWYKKRRINNPPFYYLAMLIPLLPEGSYDTDTFNVC